MTNDARLNIMDKGDRFWTETPGVAATGDSYTMKVSRDPDSSLLQDSV